MTPAEKATAQVWLCPVCGKGDTPIHKNCYGNGSHEKAAYELVPVVPASDLDKALAALSWALAFIGNPLDATDEEREQYAKADAALKALDELREPV